MNNPIANVPRELLADLLGNDHDKRIMAERHLLAMLANAPLPTGVDGLVAVKVWEADADWDDHELVVMLSDAQAVIDGLRGEVAALKEQSETRWAAYVRESNIRREIEQQRDQLAYMLREARQHHGVMLLSDPPQDAWKFYGMEGRIDAALSGIKEPQ